MILVMRYIFPLCIRDMQRQQLSQHPFFFLPGVSIIVRYTVLHDFICPRFSNESRKIVVVVNMAFNGFHFHTAYTRSQVRYIVLHHYILSAVKSQFGATFKMRFLNQCFKRLY